jgi:hypothetical protein
MTKQAQTQTSDEINYRTEKSGQKKLPEMSIRPKAFRLDATSS